MTISPRLRLAVPLLAIAALCSSNQPASAASRVSFAAERGAEPWLALGAGEWLSFGAEAEPNRGSGRALASADFDEDGVRDLVTSYANANGGVVYVQRGNVDAIYPHSAEARGRKQRGEYTAAAFFPAALSLAIPEAADFVGAGDFDADGHWDIVAARRGGTKLYWLRGDGRGAFAAATVLELPAAITALATGDVNRADGLTDLLVGIAGESRAEALVFESADGALRGSPETFPLGAAATEFAVGQLDPEPSRDIAIAAGSEVIVMHGRDRKLSLDGSQRAQVAPAAVSQTAFESTVTSVAIGDFSSDSAHELAALTADGVIHLLERAPGFDSFSAKRTTNTAVGTSAPSRLVAANVSALPKDDLLVFGSAERVQVMTARDATMQVAGSLAIGSATAAVMPMRLNSDALSDLVLLGGDGDAPAVVNSHGGATFVVNITANTSDVNQGDGVCADANGNCSFFAATQESNAHAGADTIHFNIPGAGPHVIGGTGTPFSQPVTIDGTTQPTGRVEITGGGNFPLTIYGGNSVIRGIVTYGESWTIILASSGNIVEGNYVGFRADGSKPVGFGSGGSGITFRGGTNGSLGGPNNLIGGTVAQARNVVSNCATAFSIPAADGNVFLGNYVGTTPDGTQALPNNFAFFITDSTVTIGGTEPGSGNVISGNGGAQVILLPKGGRIQGNLIGTTADGTQPLQNSGTAIEIVSGDPSTIGGTTPAARNVISANGRGFFIPTNSGGATLIQGNYIGTNAQGDGALPNLGPGVLTGGSLAVTIGGTTAGARNVISGNGGSGIEVAGGTNGVPSRGVMIQGNLIGTDANGVTALANANGISLPTASGTRLGGTTVQDRNVISGNTNHGILLGSAAADPNRIEGNYIGTNVFGSGALGNGKHGVFYSGNGALGHHVGGTTAGAGNRIAFNGGAGIASINGTPLSGPILSNSIFSNTGLGIDRGQDGVSAYAGDYAEKPVLTSVVTSGSQTTITGSLRTYTFGAQRPHTIQFFANAAADPSGHGEGQTYVGETTITAGGTVEVPFTATISPAVPAGQFVSAVAIGQGSSDAAAIYSSEFSGNVVAANRGVLQFSSATYAVNEGGGSATITVTRTGGSDGVATVDYTTADGSASGAANCGTSGADYVSSAGTLTFGNGVTEQSFTVALCQDAAVEEAETVSLALTNPNSGTTPSQASATLTINDDDGAPPPSPTPTASPSASPTPAPTASPSPTAAPVLIHVILPNRGGDKGSITSRVVGEDIAPNATVQLKRAGQADINGGFVQVSDDGSGLTTTFDLRGRAVGAWDVVVTNPGGATATLPGAFTIVEGKSYKLWAKLVRAPQFIFRSKQKGFLTIGNSGDADALVVPVGFLFPKGSPVKLNFEVIQPPQIPGYDLVDHNDLAPLPGFYDLEEKIDGYEYKTLPFVIPRIPAGSSMVLTFEYEAAEVKYLTVDYNLGAWISDPWIEAVNDPSTGQMKTVAGKGIEQVIKAAGGGDVANCVSTIVETVAREALNFVIPAKCINALRLLAFDAGTTVLSVSTGRSTVLSFAPLAYSMFDVAFRCGGEAFPAAEALVSVGTVLGNIVTDKDCLKLLGIEPSKVLAAFDPNEKIGPEGAGPERYITGRDPTAYAIYFENKPDATAPAHEVLVQDQLDVAKFDLDSLQLGPITFGDQFVLPPEGLSAWTTDVDLRPAKNLIVRIDAKLEKSTGMLTWKFTSIDAATGQPTVGVFDGFLPPNRTSPEGQGAVLFTVKLKPELATGTQVQNAARIFFDFNDPIDTPVWLNTIDNTPPVSEVFPLPQTTAASRFLVNWGGVDAGSGIARYNVFVSENGGPFRAWLTATQATSAFYAGHPNTTYSFYSVAEDAAENHEDAPLIGDATTTTLASPLLNLSTRLRVGTGENVLIGGFIVSGAEPKRVLLRGIGRSLSTAGVTDALQDPTLELFSADTLVASNDNWRDSDLDAIEATTIPPADDLESAIVVTLEPGAYTVVLRGKNESTGVGLVEAYDISNAARARLANISTRGFVDTAENVMIGGFIIGGGADTRLLIRAIGPSLANAGIAGALQDPTLELRDGNGELVRANDNWQESQADEIGATTIPPSHPAESAIAAALPPGAYTAVMRGRSDNTGVGLVEVYSLE